MLQQTIYTIGAVVGLGILAIFALPQEKPQENRVIVSEGVGVAEVAAQLDEAGIVYSKNLTQMIIILRGGERGVQAGTYVFNERAHVWDVVTRLLNGDLGLEPVMIRVPEGSTLVHMAEIFAAHLEDFDTKEFLIESNGLEGYLFPDTYLFLPTDTPERVVSVLHDTFHEKTGVLKKRVTHAGKSFDEIVIIGSLIEGEVRDPDDRRTVSGVIQNRLAIDMPLQLDVSFVYLLGKGSSDLTLEDLKYDSPYNTYQNIGLPPGPIGAPSLDAMEAAFEPEPSEYLFYLSDDSGVTYFAETFKEHVANKAQYLE